MRFTRRTRTRVLKAVLPLLAIVWMSLPWLPCCQGPAAHLAAGHTIAGHAGHTRFAAAALVDEKATPSLAAHTHHVPAVAADVAVPEADSDTPDADSDAPPCGDVVKNHNEARASAAPAVCFALASPSVILPAFDSLVGSSRPMDEPPRVFKRRPLHLAKSVLLI